ncbi:calcium:proton antiporter [Hansschlegelia zhihuaiae]|uniref:Ionic transporter n=1 Tax=Hansschlegelia zhihuaiae TaxID=405005 RepID=A0A4V1KHJ7_9HYPH|nr:ionic transporter [Hansschlegelia zhihuaiae]RXF67432.1 ionic transporter [Hansschlegelia zhihuaiae]
MASRLRPIADRALPIGALSMGLGLRFGEAQFEALQFPVSASISAVAVALLLVTVFVVLEHADAVAHRIGEPYGTLLLTFAVTTIEVSIILSMMLHGENNPTLARESVFSTVMIVCSGLVGGCLTVGGWRHRHQNLKREGTSAFLSVLIALTGLTLLLPNYTLATDRGTFSTTQLAFVGALSLLLYAGFVFAQTVRHRDDFVEDRSDAAAEAEHVPSGGAGVHLLLLMAGLGGVVLLAEHIAAGIETGLVALDVPQADAIVGALIAALVLAPEGVSALRAAFHNELQRSLNIALGSACATIGLTVPAVAVASLITGRELALGLSEGDSVLLALALLICVVSFGTGRTTILTGLVHLVVFVAYLLLIVVP